MDGSEDAEAEGAEDEESEEDQEGEVFDGSGAIIVGDLEILRCVWFGVVWVAVKRTGFVDG